MRTYVWIATVLLFGPRILRAADSVPFSPPLAHVVLQTDWYAQPEHGGFYQALAKGFYREAGLDLEIRQGGPNTGVPQRVGLGQADFGLLTSDHAILTVARGMPVKIIAAFMQHDPQAIMVHEESGITAFEQLDGKAIMAIPGLAWIDYLQNRYHIKLRIIPTNFGIAQFLADKQFVQQCYITSEPYFVSRQGGHPRVLIIAKGGWDPYRVVVTNPKFLSKHPDLVKAFVSASLRGWSDYLGSDPAPANILLAERNPKQMTPEFMAYGRAAIIENQLVLGDAKSGEYLGRLDMGRLSSLMQMMVELGMLKEPLKLDEIADLNFSPSR